jgi:hypothetical protein
VSLKRYRAVKAAVLAERGEFCEACRAPSRYVHHIIGVSMTGIASELVYEPANLMVLCDDCHALMHPGYRSYDWGQAKKGRGQAIARRT